MERRSIHGPPSLTQQRLRRRWRCAGSWWLPGNWRCRCETKRTQVGTCKRDLLLRRGLFLYELLYGAMIDKAKLPLSLSGGLLLAERDDSRDCGSVLALLSMDLWPWLLRSMSLKNNVQGIQVSLLLLRLPRLRQQGWGEDCQQAAGMPKATRRMPVLKQMMPLLAWVMGRHQALLCGQNVCRLCSWLLRSCFRRTLAAWPSLMIMSFSTMLALDPSGRSWLFGTATPSSYEPARW
mmetsp:Transcript_22507/g.52365  ORF Transcript_22507/g.52365 Transcript_22507/m.52365 type:complete len:236 (-) Transcript_22507:1444-2151(-)